MTLDGAIAAGVGYLSAAVADDGAWPASVFAKREPLAGTVIHRPPFVAALGAMSLAVCRHVDAATVRDRTLAFLRATQEPTGLWRYVHFVPPDADDTAICLIALAAGANAALVAAPRDADGRFHTWIPGPEDALVPFNEPDPVVNANVIACLGDLPETQAAQRWLSEIIAMPPAEQEATLHYYPHRVDLYAAIVRASAAHPSPAMAALREPCLAQLLACQDATGAFGDVLHTALALSALDRLGALSSQGEVVRPAVARLLATQRADGSWPACLAWGGGPGYPFCFEAATLTTACCIEALARVMGHAGAGRAATD